jgi:predicted transcriptional regulator
MADEDTLNLLALTTEIVAGYAANNSVSAGELPALIASVYGALSGLGAAPEVPPLEPQFPRATTIRKSLANPNQIISMIDGKPYLMLKRHLKIQGLTPKEYRQRYDLPADYPMTAPAYSERRRALAISVGLGRKTGAKKVATVAAPKRRGRKPVSAAS